MYGVTNSRFSQIFFAVISLHAIEEPVLETNVRKLYRAVESGNLFTWLIIS